MDERQQARADLHVHSKHSDRPSEWFLRRIGAPESFVEPADLYRTCRERGMDFVTITDHNSIDGALAIADRPGVFLSAELTTYFPEDRCKIHCLVWGLSERQFADLQQARENIYDLQRVLRAERIAHAIAHPFFRINDRLSIADVEKLILLFDRFETLNGSRDPRAGDLARAVFENLTPELVSELADRHGLEPAGETPWHKRFTGGSDDHSGLYSTCAHTVTPRAAGVWDFLDHLRTGRHEPGGRAGSSLRLAQSLWHITHSYYLHRILNGADDSRSPLAAMLRRVALGPEEASSSRTGSAVRGAIARVVRRARKRRLVGMERILVDEFDALVGQPSTPAVPAQACPGCDTTSFEVSSRILQRLSHAFLQRAVNEFRKGGLLDGLQALGALAPLGLGMAPYFTAFVTQHKDEAFLQTAAERFPGAAGHRRRSHRRAWVTDTYSDVNGVTRTIRTLAGLAAETGKDLTVITCSPETPTAGFPLRNFTPVDTFTLPEYPQQAFSFPPFLDIVAYIEEQRFDELIVSTPGPLGLCALLAARVLGLSTCGIYHTDFPTYIRTWTEDDMMQDLTWRYMRWFYGACDRVFVPSRFYRDQLVANGFDAARLGVMPRGIDLETFSPRRRNPDLWRTYGLNGGFKFLYVGRVAREKNLDTLLDAFSQFAAEDASVNLVIVGDGPELPELRERFGAEPRVAFTGLLEGDRLSEAYASADAFVFPSLTDTFGNAVLEAHASGLPAIVANQGGPPEIVATHGSGLVVEGGSAASWVDAMRQLRRSPETYDRLRHGALERARASRWQTALDML